MNIKNLSHYILAGAIFSITALMLYSNLGYEYSQPTADLWINRSYSFIFAIFTKNY